MKTTPTHYHWSHFENGKIAASYEMKGGRTAVQKLRASQARNFASFGVITFSPIKAGKFEHPTITFNQHKFSSK